MRPSFILVSAPGELCAVGQIALETATSSPPSQCEGRGVRGLSFLSTVPRHISVICGGAGGCVAQRGHSPNRKKW